MIPEDWVSSSALPSHRTPRAQAAILCMQNTVINILQGAFYFVNFANYNLTKDL